METSNRRKAMFAAAAGHTLEWYDFGVYAFVAVNIAKQIFPADNATASLLATFAAFGAGFLSRPLGAFILGRFADRRGRRAALMISFGLMGLSTLGLGLVPNYEQIGLFAPLLVLALRLAQGFSTGGEFGVSASYMVAWAPAGRRGFMGSFNQVGSAIGALMGSGFGFALSASLNPADMMAWGWRVPFLVGGVLLLLGLYLRRNAPEAPDEVVVGDQYEKAGQGYPPIWQQVLRLFFFGGAWGGIYYLTLFYLPTYAQRILGIAQRDALLASTIALICFTFAIPIAAILSDKIGRRATILTGCAISAVSSYPLFVGMIANHSFGQYLTAQLVLAVALAFISGPAPTTIVELFPPRRIAWLNSTYAIALAVIGGFTPFAVTAVVAATESQLAPVAFIIGYCALAALVMLASRETAFATALRGEPTGELTQASTAR
jgi:MHS family proline/betaine transporter-like MFS transporter